MINSTHIVAFQESTSGAVERQDRILLEKNRKRSIEPIFQEEQNIIRKRNHLESMVLLLQKKKKFVRFLMLDRVFGDWLDIYVKMIRSIQNFLDGLSYLCKQLH